MELATSIPSISAINRSVYASPPHFQHSYSNKTRPFFSPWKHTHFSAKSNRSFTKMVSDGYIARPNNGGFSNTSTSKAYAVIDNCLVMPPPKGINPRAIIKFLGGAFIGAVPEVTYGYLIEQLAKEGYLVILVPYNVTFDHTLASNQVYERFNSCLECVLSSGVPGSLMASQVVGLPVFSVGHSNGALLQVLTGSYFCDKIPKANVIISFNNRPASEAVPYFEQFGPLVNQMMPIVEANPVYSMARSASEDAWQVLIDTAGRILPESERESLTSLTKFVDQLPSVFGQVTEGVSEFKPKPPENRELCKNSYNVPNTLLVKFSSDAIDETDLLEETLKPRIVAIGGKIEKVQLNGNHLTPCIQEPKWQVGYVYTPADAIAQVLKSLSLSETRALSRTIVDWLSQFED